MHNSLVLTLSSKRAHDDPKNGVPKRRFTECKVFRSRKVAQKNVSVTFFRFCPAQPELAFFQVLPRPVPGRTGTTDLWSYWHREAIRCIDGVVPSILCTELSAVMVLASRSDTVHRSCYPIDTVHRA